MAPQQPALNLSSTRPKSETRKKREREAKPTALPPLDWAAGHGPISGALSATTGAGAVAMLGAAAGMPAPWPLAVGAIGALGHGVGHSIHRRLTLRSAVTRATSWLLAGGWTSWALAEGPLHWPVLGSLVALGVGVGAMASHAAVHEEAAEQEQLTAEARALAAKLNADREDLAHQWQDRISRVCRVQATVFAVEFWPSGAGYSLAVELPGDGSTWDRIQSAARALAADAKLPLGCTVHVEEGDRQGRAVLDVMTTNVLDAAHDYPDDLSPLSVLTGIPWGLLPNANPVVVYLRESCALILGPPGSGKSTFLDAVLSGFARCTDVLTWVIDLKAGAVGRPWVRPWLEAQGHKPTREGTTPPPADTRPGVDWIASTPAEAKRMLRAALAINAMRQEAYQDLMDEHDTTLLPVSAKLPQIQIVIDEGAELLSAGNFRNQTLKDVQSMVWRVMRTTRAMGIRLVLTAVDGNVSAIGNTQVRKFSPVGVALTSGEANGDNAGKLFRRVKVDVTQLTAKGCGVIGAAGEGGFAPTGFKGWRTAPSLARRVTLATNATRPYLDEVSARAGSEDYAGRWDADRAGWLWSGTETAGQPTDAAPTEQPGTSPDEQSVYLTDAPPTGGLSLRALNPDHRPEPEQDDAGEAGEGAADALAARFMAEIDEAYGTTDEPAERAGGLNLSSLRDNSAPATEQAEAGPEPAAGPDWLPRAIDAIRAAGPDGMKPSAVAELVGRSRLAVRAALRAAVQRGELIYRDNGPHSAYVHTDHA
ncbi:hypothetical protein [Phaeacidiphilus oryzae]|uniref:hypothetical protein n=1 Tax=Phaeacidiphilus oryzae TaxID=348818 RepID=UPI00056AC620|nr:hypothetical protein [Phaeacidiphilus oryzae]